MAFNNKSPTAEWSNCDTLTHSPSPAVLFVGAGVSIDSPTRLPSGPVLTQALLQHLMDPRVVEDLLGTLQQISSLLGRRLPRLEHILGAVCDRVGLSNSLMGGNPRDLLRLFENRMPNRLHYAIAGYVLHHRSWVITTNFDDCIEQASNWRIPVHALRSDSGKIGVGHGPSNSQWGIVKLHGSIEYGADELVTTLRDLVPGLHPDFRVLLDRVFEMSQTMIVAGYSGSDHFDVNEYLRYRRSLPKKLDLFWIEHSAQHNEHAYEPWGEDPLDTRHSWSQAFARKRIQHGPTYEILRNRFDDFGDFSTSPLGPISVEELIEWLERLFRPTEAYRHLIGARIAANVGLTQLASEELDGARRDTWIENLASDIEAKVCAQEGYFHVADRLLIKQQSSDKA